MKYLIIVFVVLLTGKASGQVDLNCPGHRYVVVWDGWVPVDSTAGRVHRGHWDNGFGYVYRCKKPTEAEMLLCLKIFLLDVDRRLTRLRIISIQLEEGANGYLGWAIIYPVADGINNLTNFKQ